MVVNSELIIFFVLAYVWAWSVYLPMVLFHVSVEWAILATMGPTIAAIVAHRATTGHFPAFRFFTGWLCVLRGTVIGVMLIILAYVALPGITNSAPQTLHWGILMSVTVYDYSALLAGPLFEEPGWRGFALPRLEASFGPVRASLLLALLWTGWHLPLFFSGLDDDFLVDLCTDRDRRHRPHDLRNQPGALQCDHSDCDARDV